MLITHSPIMGSFTSRIRLCRYQFQLISIWKLEQSSERKIPLLQHNLRWQVMRKMFWKIHTSETVILRVNVNLPVYYSISKSFCTNLLLVTSEGPIIDVFAFCDKCVHFQVLSALRKDSHNPLEPVKFRVLASYIEAAPH